MKTLGFQTFRSGDPAAEPRGIRGIKNVYGLNKDKVSVIKNGVNLERFSKDTDSGPLFRNTLGINSDTFVVITPTRIASYKGLDFLIDMVSLGKKFFTDEKVLFLVSVPDYLLSEEEMELFDNFKNKVERLEVDRIIKFTFTNERYPFLKTTILSIIL